MFNVLYYVNLLFCYLHLLVENMFKTEHVMYYKEVKKVFFTFDLLCIVS